MNIFQNIYEGFAGGIKSLTGNYNPQEKANIRDNLKRAQQNKTSMGEALQISGNVLKNGGQYNPNDYSNILILAVGVLVLLKLMD